MTKTQDQARQAAELIRKGWCQYTNARNTNGNAVGALAEDAVCWCARGAVRAVARGNTNDIEDMEMLFQDHTTFNMATFNDYVADTSEDVAKVFDLIASGQ